MDTATLAGQTRQMWDTRPLRARQAPIAGVCTGFARRYQVDVALVRVAFIGATILGGIGVFAYIAAFFLLPKEPERPFMPPAERGGPSHAMLIVAAVIAVMFAGGVGSSWPGAGLISAALLFVGWYALHQRTPVPPAGTAVSAQHPAPAPVGAWQPPQSPYPWQPVWQPPQQDPAGPDRAQPQSRAAGPEQQASAAPEQTPEPQNGEDGATSDPAPAPSNPAPAPSAGPVPAPRTQTTEEIHPPRWDPLGAAPFAWDLPEPATATSPAPIPKTRSRVTAVTLGASLLTAAGIAAVNLTGLASISPVLAAAIVLAVVGTGLVFGAFRRSGYGLLAVAIPLAGFVVIGTTAENVASGLADAPRGDHSFTVATPADLRDEYRLQAGTLKLDMRGLTLDRDRTVETHVGAGDTRITVPETMNVRVTCEVNMGNADCPDGLVTGVGADPGAPTLTIDAKNNLGNLEVDRVR